MTPQTIENFERHFDRFLADRKPGALTMLRSNALSIEQEVYDMRIAANTLINDYSIIHADSDPIDSAVLSRSAVSSMRKYFYELVDVLDKH